MHGITTNHGNFRNPVTRIGKSKNLQAGTCWENLFPLCEAEGMGRLDPVASIFGKQAGDAAKSFLYRNDGRRALIFESNALTFSFFQFSCRIAG